MIWSGIIWLAKRLRPQYGWLPFLLLLSTLAVLALSVLEVAWVSDDRHIIPALILGFLATTALVQRRARPLAIWGFVLAGGLLVAFFLVANLWPPGNVLRGESISLSVYWRNQSALFIDRAQGWLAAVSGGGRSTDTSVFALGLVLASWLTAATLAWSAYQARNPYAGLTLVGVALAANTFYGQAALYWVVFFIGLAVPAATYLNYLYREEVWERQETDYSPEVRRDLLLYTAGLSLGIMSLAMAIPAINFRAIAEAFQRQEMVISAEETMARAFAGVAQPRTDEGVTSGGGLPRSFLIGGDPELTETIVMTASVRSISVPSPNLAGFHWRSVSFDVYTGAGWRRSPEREENVPAGQPIPNPRELSSPLVTLSQEVDWIYDNRATRYTVGRPVTFSHDLTTLWRGQDDLVGVRGRNSAPSRYSVESQVTMTSSDELRQARLEDVPPEILGRYTALPNSLPPRVRELARQITRTGDSGREPPPPYDQVRAIETFLHQYPYTLDLPAPPPDVDIVDYFLFDLQTGFCDYFASAMVVMARAVGLPARLGVGFLQQPPDEQGVQTIRQANAHSWAEIYFAGVGWVEFEPTAPFIVAPPAPDPVVSGTPPIAQPPSVGSSIAIPGRAPQRNIPWLPFMGLAALALVAAGLWGRLLSDKLRSPDKSLDEVQRAYFRLQESAVALGSPPHPAQTPAEFTDGLLASSLLEGEEGRQARPAIERLVKLFTERQYGRANPAAIGEDARNTWDSLRSPLRRLVWRKRLGRSKH